MSSPFDAIHVGALELKNRLAMAPIKTAFGTPTGRVTDRLLAYFRHRAAGGVGLIISEPLYVDKRGQEHPKQLSIADDAALEGLGRLAQQIHEGGARVFAHLNHGGRAANPKAAGAPPEAPSKVTCPRTGVEPQELTEQRMGEIVRAFAAAARRAQSAGFDGVELQFGLGYLVAQFLSPRTNLRTDGYGGDIEGRMRFAREVFSAVREAVGEGFPIGVRISGSEKCEGLEIEDAQDLARRLEQWGADLIHVATGSNCESLPWYFQHAVLPPGVNEALAAKVRSVVKLPVMAAGRLGDPSRIREVLQQQMVDMVAVGRPLLADPNLPRKMQEGLDDHVLLCGHCLQGCFARVASGEGIGCNVNPEVGRELEEVTRVEDPLRVVVVGGGPAGMQAALTARRRGHSVTLFEKQPELGGQFSLAFLAPGKARMEHPLRSMIAQVRRAGIELRLGEAATVEGLRSIRPDAVIVATGSSPITLELPGLTDAITGEDVLSKQRSAGDRTLVVGGGMIGMEVAEFLATQGKQCVVIEMLEEVARDMDPLSRKLLMKRVGSLPVEIHTKTRLVRIDDGQAIVETAGEERNLGPVDAVVVSVGSRSFDPLSAALRQEGLTVQVVGDAAQPAQICQAVNAGHTAALAT